MVGKLALLAVFTASQAFAAPVSLDSACGLDDFSLELPQSVIDDGMQVPEGAPKFVALGRGVQNYTCVDGAFDVNQAVATLFDASCSPDIGNLGAVTSEALSQANPPNNDDPAQTFMGFKKLGHHFFQNLTPDAESSTPTFDFRSTGAGDFVSVSKDLASKDESPENVAWLQLSSIGGQGSLASSVYRVNPAGGVADSTCSEEGEISTFEYAAVYVFY